jgi:hypothetical protein
MAPLLFSYKFSISHNNGAMTKHGGEHIFLFKESPQMMMKVVWVV